MTKQKLVFILNRIKKFKGGRLNEKERHWIKFFETRNQLKGYNLSEGGEGGGHHKITRILLSRIAQEKAKDPEFVKKVSKGVQKKYQEREYREKQIKERRERAQDSKWKNKMTKINRDKAQNLEWKKKVTDIALKKWKQSKYVEKQLKSREKIRKVIENNEVFLRDIKVMKKKDIDAKYGLSSKTTNRYIQHILGHQGITNYTKALSYLRNNKVIDVLEDIEINKEKQLKEKIAKRQNLENKEQFLKDIRMMEKKDICIKYGISSKTTNSYIRRMLGHLGIMNYVQARDYLKSKNLDDVLKDNFE